MSRMNKLFFCIPQEVGPIIIPLLWLKTPYMISVYFIITVVIGIIIIMGNIAALVEFIVHKTTILGRCSNNDSCDNAYGNYLAIAIFSTVISIFLSVHFAVVINDYRHNQNGTGPYAPA
ncbi:hypothetical protein RhiirA4_528473 [Rhizophagus irregularis]|uniref:Uncharacterized protein n=1 Tax=Rhizophagus irregularis TaxID=588596 RepID=A0A2I1FZN2_9GLOM|nr:hypothetical protein RhiirA4_528473 [Rhizophagus irregularis]